MDIRGIQAFLFDLDGTLVDSYLDAELAWTGWARSAGVLDQLDFPTLYGRRKANVVGTLRPDLDAVALAEQVALVGEAECELTANVRPLTGSTDLLAELDPVAWAIVTSDDRAVALARIRAAGLSEPAVLVTEDEVARGKPDPQGLLMAATALGASPRRCVAFDDSPAGIAAARAAGMWAVAIRFRHEDAALGEADAILDNVGQVALRPDADGYSMSVR